MKATVTLELNDENEVRGLTQFMAEVEAYRNPAKAVAAAAAPAAPVVSEPEPGVVVASDAPREPQVIATITPKTPKTAEVNAALLKYVEKHKVEGAMQLLQEYGATKITEVKGTALIELYRRLQEGVK